MRRICGGLYHCAVAGCYAGGERSYGKVKGIIPRGHYKRDSEGLIKYAAAPREERDRRAPSPGFHPSREVLYSIVDFGYSNADFSHV